MLNNDIENFKYLDNLIHSGVKEIVLDSDIVLGSDEESQYLNGIKLDVDDLAIDGNGHAIDALGLTRIFYCTGKNITIKNIILKNGYAKQDGGAIHNFNGGLTITGSTLTGNAANHGGAIRNDRGELTITGSTLAENTARWDGGAIESSWGELTVTESALNNNTAKKDGGALYNYEGELTIIESALTENTANHDGGAIYSKNKIHMKNCTLIDNLQSSFSFVENNDKYDIGWNDDVILSDDVTIYLDNKCEGEYHNSDNLIEWNKTLSNGTHEIILELNDDNRIIMNFTYSSDIMAADVNSYVELINSVNKAKHVIAPQYIINLNKGDYNATGTIFWKAFSNLNLIINGNGITLNGQSAWQFIRIGTDARLTLDNIALTNYTEDKGGAIYNMGELTITGSALTGNTAKDDGGAIYNGSDGELTITGSVLTGNTAVWGGAIRNVGELTIIESTLTQNTAEWNGGAIDNSWGELTVTESAINNNAAINGGGAIYNYKDELTITESVLTGNMAWGGGAIYNGSDGVLTVTESALNENAADYGGAIFLKESRKYESINCTFNDNNPDEVYMS